MDAWSVVWTAAHLVEAMVVLMDVNWVDNLAAWKDVIWVVVKDALMAELKAVRMDA